MSNRESLNQIGIAITTALINTLQADLRWKKLKARVDSEGRDASDEELAALRSENQELMNRLLRDL